MLAFADERKPLVLVVDDEINTTIMLQYIFEREGYNVERVTDGATAIEVAGKLLPDLILLDILLPRMNGFEVLAKLKADPLTEHIPTILITANAREPADVAQGMNLGADDYLYKPFAPQELLARAQSKMRARQLEEDLRLRSQELEILLAASERLSEHLHREQVMEVAIQLVREVFPADFVLVDLVDIEDYPTAQTVWARNPNDYPPSYEELLESHLGVALPSQALTLNGDRSRTYNGMLTSLQNSNQALGILAVFSRNTAYSQRQVRLLEGIGRQVAMALRNAELYHLQAVYTQELEQTVQARTDELISANKLLVRNEKLASIGHLAASIAHEINNPLMPIGLLLEQLEESLVEANFPFDVQDLEIVRENVGRIQRIVRSLLDFARQDIGGLRAIDVSKTLEAVEKLNRHHFEMEHLKIRTELEPAQVVYGSKDQLEAVFMNLALNAQAAMKPGGILTIRVGCESDSIVIQFEDTGTGIAQQDLDKIFDPFFSTKQNGTGLGLFVSYSVIEGHHGTISVASEVGVGTCFTIRLPRHEA